MLVAIGIHIYAADSRILYCDLSIEVEKKHNRCKKNKIKLSSKSKQKKMCGTSQIKCHLLNIQNCIMASNQFLEKRTLLKIIL